jgi:ribosome maturation factor RimP
MKLSETTTEAIRATAAEKGCRVLAVENTGAGRFSVIRVVLERAGGEPVTVDDCEAVSRQVSALLDAADEIPHRYALEVSSAGLERKLYTLEDARRFVGRRVRIQTDRPVEPEALDSKPRGAALPSRRFAGILRSVEADLLTVVDEENRKIYNVRFGDIRVARLDFRWPERAN